ncbi:MAG TPA: hypothetical protein PKA64_24070 [Myxococcota bacterium]|nr:hypothetical protein [Myxococcota bacterium]
MKPCLLLLPLALLACGPDDGDASGDDTDAEPVDLRVDYPEPAPDAMVFETPDLVIPAYSDVQFCYALTYDGAEDLGIVHMANYQGPGGHHLVIFGTTSTQRDVPDGTLWDCTSTSDLNMEDMEPVIFGGVLERDDEMTVNTLDLPDGMGVVLQAGQRMVIQSHYINTHEYPILVHDQAQFDVIPEDDVQTWASPFALSNDRFDIPAGATDYTSDFTCHWSGEPVNLLFLGPHMHEWGKAFRFEQTPAGGGDPVALIDEPTWDPVYRDAPNIQRFDGGQRVIQTGDALRTSCTWFNDTEANLVFPHEMCVTFGLVFPQKLPWICDAGDGE